MVEAIMMVTCDCEGDCYGGKMVIITVSVMVIVTVAVVAIVIVMVLTIVTMVMTVV